MVAAIISAADQTGSEQRAGEETTQQSFTLFVIECLLRRLVFDQLECEEVAGPADITHDRQVEQFLDRLSELTLVGLHMLDQAVPLEDVEVRERYRAGDRMSGEGD